MSAEKIDRLMRMNPDMPLQEAEEIVARAERMVKIRNSFDLTQDEFAERIGKKRRTVQEYEAGDRKIDMTLAKLITHEFKINPEWLSGGEGGMFLDESLREGVSMIPIYNVYASAGYGAWVNGEAITGYYPMPDSLLARELRVKPKNINLLHVKGDSMTPVLHDGDLVAIDRSRVEAVKGLYVCRVENELYIKNVTFQSQVVVLSSENPLYDPIVASYEDFELIGQVVWFGRAL